MRAIVARYPVLTLGQSIALARMAVAIFFMAHAIGRIAWGTIPVFANFMEAVGFPNGFAVVWLITLSEIVCGILLILNRHVRLATIPLLAIAVGGIVLIHARQGWFVGEHGTGGSEYSVALIVLLLIVASADRNSVTSYE